LPAQSETDTLGVASDGVSEALLCAAALLILAYGPMLKLPLAAIALSATALPSLAGTVEISDNSKILPGVAHQTTGILVNAGAPIEKISKDVYVVTAHGLNCEERTNNAVDSGEPESALETYKCRINSDNSFGSTKGQPFGDAGIMLELLGDIEAKTSEKVIFTDTAMGQSSTYVKTISCTIHTNIDNIENGGRWSCVYTDWQ
jgi:hypothetical protein